MSVLAQIRASPLPRRACPSSATRRAISSCRTDTQPISPTGAAPVTSRRDLQRSTWRVPVLVPPCSMLCALPQVRGVNESRPWSRHRRARSVRHTERRSPHAAITTQERHHGHQRIYVVPRKSWRDRARCRCSHAPHHYLRGLRQQRCRTRRQQTLPHALGYVPRIYLATDAPAVRAELDASPFGPFIAPIPAHIKPAEEKSWASHPRSASVTTVARDELLILARADAVIVHSQRVSFSHTLHRAFMCIRARPCPSDTRTRMPPGLDVLDGRSLVGGAPRGWAGARNIGHYG